MAFIDFDIEVFQQLSGIAFNFASRSIDIEDWIDQNIDKRKGLNAYDIKIINEKLAFIRENIDAFDALLNRGEWK